MRVFILSTACVVFLATGCGTTDTNSDAIVDAAPEVTDATPEDIAPIDSSPGDVGGDTNLEDNGEDTTDNTPWRVRCLADPDCGTVMVAAHRGAHLAAPENSLAALRAAAQLGADFVEIDVRNTIDDGLVVTHDDSVATSTNGRGFVSQMTTEDVRALTLTGATEDHETQKVPLFSEALSLARELDVMLYLDSKTDRFDLVVDEIAAGGYHDVVLYREEWDTARQAKQRDNRIMIMPPVPVAGGDPVQDAAIMLAEFPDLKIVEYAAGGADIDVYDGLMDLGLKVQQDVLVGGDVMGGFGDYTGYKSYVDAGITLMQTDYPHLLVPAVVQFNETGIFPESGPGATE